MGPTDQDYPSPRNETGAREGTRHADQPQPLTVHCVRLMWTVVHLVCAHTSLSSVHIGRPLWTASHQRERGYSQMQLKFRSRPRVGPVAVSANFLVGRPFYRTLTTGYSCRVTRTPQPQGRKPRTRSRRSQQSNTVQMRAQYRGHLVTRDGRPYNPVLNDPQHPNGPPHPDNTRNLSHDTPEGYNLGCCRCAPCRKQGKLLNDATDARRVQKKVASHRSIIRDILSGHAPFDSALEAAVDLVLNAGEVVHRHRAKIRYMPVALEAALWRWQRNHAPSVGLTDDQIATVITALTERLSE